MAASQASGATLEPLDAFVTETIGIGDVEAAFAKMHGGEVLRSVVVL